MRGHLCHLRKVGTLRGTLSPPYLLPNEGLQHLPVPGSSGHLEEDHPPHVEVTGCTCSHQHPGRDMQPNH